MLDRPEPVAVVSGPMGFEDLLQMLSDLHSKQVKGLEVEVASTRELLAQARRKSQHDRMELEAFHLSGRVDSTSSLPGATDHADAWARARSCDPAATPPRPEFSEVVPLSGGQTAPPAVPVSDV